MPSLLVYCILCMKYSNKIELDFKVKFNKIHSSRKIVVPVKGIIQSNIEVPFVRASVR